MKTDVRPPAVKRERRALSIAAAVTALVLVAVVATLAWGRPFFGRQPATTQATATAQATVIPTATATPPPPTDLTHGKWSQGAHMEVARSETAASVLNGLVYVPGGLPGPSAVMEAYDPVANSWHRVADMPGPRHHLMTTSYAGRVYVFGGTPISGAAWVPSNNAWAYDPVTNSWAILAPMPEARLAGAAVTLGDALYVVGGVGGSQALLRYDPGTNRWTKLARLQVPREHLAAVALGGRIYAIGGRWAGQGERTSVEVYNPATNTWRYTGSLHIAHAGCSAAVLYGQIVVAGGEYFTSSPPRALKIVEVYNPATQVWSVATPMPVGLHGDPVASVGGKVYVLGGSDVPGHVVNAGRVLIYSVG